MSHVMACMDFAVSDLDLLAEVVARTCPELELVEQTTYRNWATDHGRLVGDYKPPAWMKAEDVGKNAVRVLRFKEGCGPKGAYEIGFVEHPERPGEYVPVADFWNQGSGLLNAKGLGKHYRDREGDQYMDDLKKAYHRQLCRQAYEAEGLSVEEVEQDGEILLKVRVAE